MPTEIAILPLTHPLTPSNPTLPPSLIKKLQTAKLVLETASGFDFFYFQQAEDPSIIYIIGEWESVEAHGVFLKSKENLALLEQLKDDIVREGEGDKIMQMWHLDTSIKTWIMGTANADDKTLLTTLTIRFEQMFVLPENSKAFRKSFEEYIKPYQVIAGKRIEKGNIKGKEREEWGILSPSQRVDRRHMGLPETESDTRYQKVLGCLDAFENRYLKAIEGL